MKYCEKCGCELEDNAVTCEKCGNTIIPKRTVILQQSIKNSRIGILAFVLSIIGFMTGYLYIGVLFDIVAIVLAIIALKKSKSKSVKKGLPIAGLIIAVCAFISMFCIYTYSIINYTPTPTKEEMLAEAQRINIETIADEAENNINIAKTKYDGKIYTTGAVVNRINEDYIQCACSWGYILNALQGMDLFSDTTIYFANSDDLLKLNKGDNIKVIGKFELSGSGNYTIKNAYLLDDEEYNTIQ